MDIKYIMDVLVVVLGIIATVVIMRWTSDLKEEEMECEIREHKRLVDSNKESSGKPEELNKEGESEDE